MLAGRKVSLIGRTTIKEFTMITTTGTKVYTFHFINGSQKTVKAVSAKNAFAKAGIGAGARIALDFYEVAE